MSGAFLHLTGRLGFNYATEYKNHFLMQYNVISGCCTPPDFYLFDKNTGRQTKVLGRLIYYSTDKKLPFAVSIELYDPKTGNSPKLSRLKVYNVDQNKSRYVELPKNELEKAMEETDEMYAEYLFTEPRLDNNILTLSYYIKKPVNKPEEALRTIKIKL